MTTDLTLLRQDTGELLPVTEWAPPPDPLPGPTAEKLPLPIADSMDAWCQEHHGRSFDAWMSQIRGEMAAVTQRLADLGIPDVQPTSPDVTETRLKVDELAATMKWAEVPFDRDGALAGLTRKRPGELGTPDAMTAFMRRGSSEDLPGTVVGTGAAHQARQVPALHPRDTSSPGLPDDQPTESRWSRWARNAGDFLAWIGGRS